ncbi:MAG: FG-GAP repeat domain-containing protein, partial [Pyrinomonadaceae bacterium]
MFGKMRLMSYLALALMTVGCSSAASTPPAERNRSEAKVQRADKEWKQSSWKAGPGRKHDDDTSAYDFASGIEVRDDGSIALSRLNTASATLNDDLNHDGYTDLIVANSGNYEFVDQPFAQIRHKNPDHAQADAQIYWGGPDGYDTKRATGIPGDRPSSLAVIDFNLDGILDIAVAGGGEFHPPYVNSRVYWGTPDGYSKDNCTLLPTNAATGTAVGDFNKDGYPDLVFANLGDYNFPFPPSLVYWGGPDGFLPTNRTELETNGVGGLAVADVNNDGWLDIVFANSAGFPPIDQLMDYGQNYPWPDSFIYVGGPEGFSKNRRISLPTRGATGVKVADLNKDGYPDIVFANAGSFALPPLPDTYVYWGGPNGYSVSRRADLRTNGASAVSVADLNKDGWPDLALSVTGTYLYIGKPEFPDSFVYWGGPSGYSDTRRLGLHTEGSQG